MSVRFYNPGNRIYEQLRFDHPINIQDQRNINAVSYFQLEAPEKSFFEVPDVLEITPDSGEPIQVSVDFASRVQRDFIDYGIVRIDLKRDTKKKPIREEENIATNDKDAKTKGDLRWREFLEAKAREHIQNVEQAHSIGGVPSRARGIYAHALKTLGIEDPADRVGNAIRRTDDNEKIANLERQVAELVAALGGKK